MAIELVSGPVNRDVSDFFAALDHPEVHRELERISAVQWGGKPGDIHARPLWAHRRRCTFEVALTVGCERRELIAKVYTDDQSNVYRFMCAASLAGFDRDAAFSIPQPLAWLPELGVRLEEKVAGPTVKDVIRTRHPTDWAAAADRSGEWLGRFHSTAPRPEWGKPITAKLAHCHEAATRQPALRDKADALLRRLDRIVPTAQAGLRCAGHGSFVPDHVILCDERTVVIDLDEGDCADPSRDVAWFLVTLKRRAIQLLGAPGALDAAAEAFLRSYAGCAPPGALAHLAPYEALVCLSRARRDLYKKKLDLAAYMLDEGLRLVSA